VEEARLRGRVVAAERRRGRVGSDSKDEGDQGSGELHDEYEGVVLLACELKNDELVLSTFIGTHCAPFLRLGPRG
jgi:hypothetical protein